MKKIILSIALFACFFQAQSQVVNAIPICHGNGDPNGIAILDIVDQSFECAVYVDTFSNVAYLYTPPTWTAFATGGGDGDDVSAFTDGTTITPSEKLVSPDSLYTFAQLVTFLKDSIGVASVAYNGSTLTITRRDGSTVSTALANVVSGAGAPVGAPGTGQRIYINQSDTTLWVAIGANWVQFMPTSGNLKECELTITQTAHGFSVKDVVYWTGTAYADFVGVYGDAETPVGIVTDSLTANTFKLTTCGIVDTTFGLAAGTYFATDSGISATPDTVRHPILKIFDSKAQVLSMPAFDEDLTGVGLFNLTNANGTQLVKGGDTIELDADSIAAFVIINGDTVYNVGQALDSIIAALGVSSLDSLAELLDVDTANLAEDNFLRYNNGVWKNFYLPFDADTANTVSGYGVGLNRVNWYNVTANGYRSLASLQSNVNSSTNGIVAIGSYSLENYNYNSTVSQLAIGHRALRSLGTNGTATQLAIGTNALASFIGDNGNGLGNVGVGHNSLSSLTTGWGNIGLGNNTLTSLTTTIGNIGIGSYAGSAYTAAHGFFVGYQNGQKVTGGNNYIGIGNQSFNTGDNRDVSGIFIGHFVGGLGTYTASTIVGNYNADSFSNGTSITLLGLRSGAKGIGNLTRYTSERVTAVGAETLVRAYSTESILMGYGAGNSSRTPNAIVIGNAPLSANYSGGNPTGPNYGLRADSSIIIGHNHGNVPFDNTLVKTSSVVDDATDLLTVTAHNFGSTGTLIQLKSECTSCPGPILNNSNYMFEVVDANTLKSVVNLTSKGDSLVTLTPRTRTNNAITIGNDLVPVERQIKIGTGTHTNLISRNYNFNISQSLGASNDGQAMIYNHTSGELEVGNVTLPGTNREITASASYTASDKYATIVGNDTNNDGSPIVYTLTASPVNGDHVTIIVASSDFTGDGLQVNANGKTINGSPTFDFSTQYQAITIEYVSSGSIDNWFIR